MKLNASTKSVDLDQPAPILLLLQFLHFEGAAFLMNWSFALDNELKDSLLRDTLNGATHHRNALCPICKGIAHFLPSYLYELAFDLLVQKSLEINKTKMCL